MYAHDHKYNCKQSTIAQLSGEYLMEINKNQAGAELCQAQEKLGLAKTALSSTKLCLSSI